MTKDFSIEFVEDQITDIYRKAYEQSKPAIARLNPNEGLLGFWWEQFDRLVEEKS